MRPHNRSASVFQHDLRITSDATGDAVISGTLTRIDPWRMTAAASARPSRSTGRTAACSSVISLRSDRHQRRRTMSLPSPAMPWARTGTATYVLRRTGGEGTDMTFEEVAVTEGDTNDYYVEITGDDLHGATLSVPPPT